jgi:hypothetical protein
MSRFLFKRICSNFVKRKKTGFNPNNIFMIKKKHPEKIKILFIKNDFDPMLQHRYIIKELLNASPDITISGLLNASSSLRITPLKYLFSGLGIHNFIQSKILKLEYFLIKKPVFYNSAHILENNFNGNENTFSCNVSKVDVNSITQYNAQFFNSEVDLIINLSDYNFEEKYTNVASIGYIRLVSGEWNEYCYRKFSEKIFEATSNKYDFTNFSMLFKSNSDNFDSFNNDYSFDTKDIYIKNYLNIFSESSVALQRILKLIVLNYNKR